MMSNLARTIDDALFQLVGGGIQHAEHAGEGQGDQESH